MNVRVLIADREASFRAVLRRLLEGTVSIAGEAGTSEEAARVAEELGADVVLMDIGIAGAGGVREIKSLLPASKVVLLTAHDEEAYLSATGKSGADSFLPKRLVRTELLAAVRALVAGRPWATWPSRERRERQARPGEVPGWDGSERRTPPRKGA